MAELGQGLGLNLADALARDTKLAADFLERTVMSVDKAKAQLDNLALTIGKRVEHLRELHIEPRSLADWCPQLDERLLSLAIGPLCDRLRLMFFGNLAQDWSEFVLADLGIFRYEQVPITPVAHSTVNQPLSVKVSGFKVSPFGRNDFSGVSVD